MGKCPLSVFDVGKIALNEADLFAQLANCPRQIVLDGEVKK
jgi:hypothetical protein